MYSIFGFLSKQKKEKDTLQNETKIITPIMQNSADKECEENNDILNTVDIQVGPSTKKVKKILNDKKKKSKRSKKNSKTVSEKKSKKKSKNTLQDNVNCNERLDSDRIVLEIQKIDKNLNTLKIYHDRIFHQIVNLIKKHNDEFAKLKSFELSIIRKKMSQLENSKKSLEHVSIRLSLIYDINETLEVLDPILRNTIKEPIEKSSKVKKNRKKTDLKCCSQENYNWKTFLTNLMNDTIQVNGIKLNLESIDDVRDIFSKVFVPEVQD